MAKPYRRRRLNKTQKARAKKTAQSLSPALAHAAFSRASNKCRTGRLGKLGAASGVRHISAEEWLLEKEQGQ